MFALSGHARRRPLPIPENQRMEAEPTASTASSPGSTRRLSRAALAAVLLMAPALQVGNSALAAPNGGGDPDEVQSSESLQDDDALGYWTAARMAAADSAEVDAPASDEPPPASSPPAAAKTAAPELRVAPTDPGMTARAPGSKEGAGGDPQASADKAAASGIAIRVPRPYTDAPARLNGKVFFQKARNGKDFACSGTAVTSANASVILTAGHCVNEGRVNGKPGEYHRKWIFVPAFSSTSPGEAPFGRWPARRLFATNGWVTQRAFGVDVGAAVVRQRNGQTLGSRVGGQGVLFNQSRDQVWNVFGYPAQGRFSPGNLQYRCTSGPIRDSDRPVSSPIQIECNMTGGASGGGWIVRMDGTGHGFLNGVNSFKRGSPKYFYGPYFGDAAMNVYTRASAA